MVKLCSGTYGNTPSPELATIFEGYASGGLTLDHFQRHAIEAIEASKHILITAHTGSGKTLPAEHAIRKFCRDKTTGSRRRVIYTAPIKSLSNQKYHEFTRKYPDITFGIMTGDIKANPEADCVIMTTEILRNSLYFKGSPTAGELSFVFNPTEFACVVFDEVHYINDPDRGRVWEEVFMILPKHIQCVMLSATIDRPETFAGWVEATTEREVWVAGTNIRVVPLIHSSYFALSPHNIRDIKDASIRASLSEIDGTLITLKDATTSYNHAHIERLHIAERYMRLHHVHVKRQYVLNRAIGMLKERRMLPAICFVFSRRSADEWAEEIEHGLFDVDDEREKTFPSIVEREAREILRKMPNHREYASLPEYARMMRLLQKGVAVHHSGVLPVLRELIELLFARGFIKLLFATETFAVGVNMPTKTVLFTALSKFDGRTSFRNLASHEYTQMAGRAGRRGLDTIGHVIHLNNLFDIPEHTEYQTILSGKPQAFESRFKIDCGLILRIMAQSGAAISAREEVVSMIEKSSLSREVGAHVEEFAKEGARLSQKLTDIELALLSCGMSEEDMAQYDALLNQLEASNRRKRDRIQAQIDEFRRCHLGDGDVAQLDEVYALYKKKEHYIAELTTLRKNEADMRDYIGACVENIFEALKEGGYVSNVSKEDGAGAVITPLGRTAAKIQEIPGLAMAKFLEAGGFDRISPRELAAVLSVFTEIRVRDEDALDSWRGLAGIETSGLLEGLEKCLHEAEGMEMSLRTPYDAEKYRCQYNIYDAIYGWCMAENEGECRAILSELEKYGVFAGEFVKAVLKIQNIVRELTEVAEMTENLQLQATLAQVPGLLLKFIATNQSLYV